jgi:hypothetical protein
VAAAVRSTAIEKTLLQLATLLESVGELRRAETPRSLASEISEAGADDEYQAAVRKVVRLFGGMGSFQDVILQTRQGVRPEQAEFERLLDRLFQETKQEVR